MLDPMLMLVVEDCPIWVPADIVYAAVFTVCSETGLGLAESVLQARAAVALHLERRAARDDDRRLTDGAVLELADCIDNEQS